MRPANRRTPALILLVEDDWGTKKPDASNENILCEKGF